MHDNMAVMTDSLKDALSAFLHRESVGGLATAVQLDTADEDGYLIPSLDIYYVNGLGESKIYELTSSEDVRALLNFLVGLSNG